MQPGGRLDGLDLARFLAFAGMVLVNFSVFIGVSDTDPSFAAAFLQIFQGKAAATFVVLAGLGLALAFHRGAEATIRVTLKRALFLFVIGVLNMQVFDADILHYYAVWFALATVCFAWSSRQLMAGIIAIPLAFILVALVVDYETGWDWATLTYTDLWTPGGFLRNLMFNGWHPVLPWFAFILFGLWLARRNLADAVVQKRLALWGAGALAGVELLSLGLSALDPEIAEIAGTSPIPPGPFYMIAGMASASMVTGFCLWICGLSRGHRLTSWLRLAGRQSLTLYIAHIFVGMGVMEAMNLEGSASATLTIQASLFFLAACILYARAWLWISKRGPLEMLMRKLAG